jgi:hypothetical protein
MITEVSKLLYVQHFTFTSTTFPLCNAHSHTWTSPDRIVQNQNDHTLIHKRRWSRIHSNSYRGTESESDNYLLIAKLKERTAVNNSKIGKQRAKENILTQKG